MPNNRNLKSAVRARMAETGEKYTVALRIVQAEGEARMPEAESDATTATVREWFVEALQDILAPEHFAVIEATVLLDMQEGSRGRQRQSIELCNLLDHAFSSWCGDAVLATGRDGMEQGLQSVNRIFEPWEAGLVLARVQEYRASIAGEPITDLLPADSAEAVDAAQADEDALRILGAFETALRPVAEHARRDVIELSEPVMCEAARGCAEILMLAIEADVVANVEADAIELRDRLAEVSGRLRAKHPAGAR